MSEIKLKKGDSVEKALKKLKKKIDREGVMDEVRRRRHFEKPSEIKYKKKQRAKFNAKMESIWNKENL